MQNLIYDTQENEYSLFHKNAVAAKREVEPSSPVQARH